MSGQGPALLPTGFLQFVMERGERLPKERRRAEVAGRIG
jgi:hypothetical protein